MEHRFEKRAWRPVRNERGSVMITVAISIVALLAFAMVAIDAAILMTTKGQLQAAADAAALAGASGLGEGSQAVARERALAFASFNRAVQETLAPVLITDADVTFPTETSIRVVTHRTAATGDPLKTYFLRVVDLANVNTADVTATATAQVVAMCATTCCKPWAVPDRWNDVDGDLVYDTGEPYDPIGTGYNAPADVGASIVLKVGHPNSAIAPGQFYPIDFPPLGSGERLLTGGDYYRQWITTCSPYAISLGDSMELEPGNMVGPTTQGVADLVALDPGAYWDPEDSTIRGSAYGRSPRIVVTPFFDPRFPPVSGRNHVHITKLGAFFLEGVGQGNSIYGRFMKLAVPGVPCPGGGTPPGGFLVGFSLTS